MSRRFSAWAFAPQVSQSADVILRSSTGSKIGVIALEYLLINLGHFHVRYNKRGNIKHAIRKERSALSPLSNNGTGFEQHLDSGRVVFALRGVRGSERTAAATA